MGYWARWNATNEIPERAVAEGITGHYGTVNPTDGGNTSRFSLSGRWNVTDEIGITRANAYVVRYWMNLCIDVTYFLNDPVNGDQFRQLDDWVFGGAEVSHVFQGDLSGMPMEIEIGVQTRTDSMRVGLFNTHPNLGAVRELILDERMVGFRFSQSGDEFVAIRQERLSTVLGATTEPAVLIGALEEAGVIEGGHGARRGKQLHVRLISRANGHVTAKPRCLVTKADSLAAFVEAAGRGRRSDEDAIVVA